MSNELIPELELCITPTENNDLRVELMHEGFITYLKEKNLFVTESNTGITYIKVRELSSFMDHLQKLYTSYTSYKSDQKR
jgi:hypothetical protein